MLPIVDLGLEKIYNKNLHTPLIKKIEREEPVPDNNTTRTLLELVKYTCRGFQRRNWNHLRTVLERVKADKNFISSIYYSWVKFKILASIDRLQKQTLVWIFKNYIDFEGQEIFDDLFQLSRDKTYEEIIEYFDEIDSPLSHYRLIRYFFEADGDFIVPATAFPLLFPKKESKMKYCRLNTKKVNLKKLHEIVTEYISDLNIKDVFCPPGDILGKIGYQKYNDDGEVKFDYERSTKPDSGFKYQHFLAQPMKPREVWLPGKSIKANNMFWMSIGRQILQRDPAYAPNDLDGTLERIKEAFDEQINRFDISGFGFQFQRNMLLVCAQAIAELYPSSQMDEQVRILHEICDSLEVELPNGCKITPPRGIGLGYYEDLKTIVMLSILLYDLNGEVISLYGDQGLILGSSHIDERLRSWAFVIKPDKVESVAHKQKVLWGGFTFTNKGYTIDRGFSEKLIGSLFFSPTLGEKIISKRTLW